MMTTLPTSLWLDLLGKPFLDEGRGPDAYDCVGLLLEIQRRLGRALPPYASDTHELAHAFAQWEPVADPQPGDAILLRSDQPRWHVAVYCGDGYMIHAHSACGVVRERISAFPWHKRVEGYYRWKQA